MGPIDEFAMKMVSSFLAAIFVVFAFGLFNVAAEEFRDAYSQAEEATQATQPDCSDPLGGSFPLAYSQGTQG